jgi:hypothetical protein
MMRLVRELDRVDAGRPPRGVGVRARGVQALAAIGCALVVAGAALLGAHQLWGVTLTGDGLRAPQPLGKPPQVATGVGTFEFMLRQPDDPMRPVTYDPCRTVEFEVNDALAPAGAAALLEDAVGQISRATGLRFHYIGRTDRLPDPDARPVRPSPEPALIAWTTADVVPALAGRTAGVGGSTARLHTLSGDLEYVTGVVALDSPDLSAVMARPQGPQQVRAVVIHELGHLVGLGHVGDPGELMYGDNAGLMKLGPGDREGLALLGSGRCYP